MLQSLYPKTLKLFFVPTQDLPRRRAIQISAAISLLLLSISSFAQDTAPRGRKYQAPPVTAHVSVAVVKDANGKQIENAAVVFHLIGQEGKGNMELKTNEEGKAIIDVIPKGDTVRIQVIADGFQTFGEDYKIDADSKDITVRLKRPGQQYSTYTHPNTASGTAPATQDSAPKQSSTQTPPKQ
jgi:hypothetical protein